MNNYDDIPEYKRVPKIKPKTDYEEAEVSDSDALKLLALAVIVIIFVSVIAYLFHYLPTPMDVYMREYSKCITADLPATFCKKLAMEVIR